tara:strand:- start:181 stop:591 length:411 start_codon:yes stop_codon:yes gene_type:complete
MQQIKRAPQWTNPINVIVPKFTYAGKHILADFWHGKTIETEKELEELLRGAAKAANSKALKVSLYKFEPQGITGIILLAESHIAVHTWPEIGYIAVDVFTCGKKSRPKEAMEFFRAYLQPKTYHIQEMKRGNMPRQ